MMQDHFLFDDDDRRKRGKGCDSLCSDDNRLKFKWQWSTRYQNKKRQPCQISEARLKNGWSLEAIFWHTEYEARVERCGNYVDSYNIDYYKETKRKPSLKTRLNAQLKAEDLFEQIGIDILKQCKR